MWKISTQNETIHNKYLSTWTSLKFGQSVQTKVPTDILIVVLETDSKSFTVDNNLQRKEQF